MKDSKRRLHHTSVIKINGTIVAPPGANPYVIVPDEVVEWCARTYGLDQPGHRTIDPMCGVGTIPRVIMAMGGGCDAMDIDPQQCAMAKQALPDGARIILGDCLQLAPGPAYDCVYTSLPFVWFDNYPHKVPAGLAAALRRFLKAGGMLIVDSDDETVRGGRSWPLASVQAAYFTANGFRFDESWRFVTRSNQPGRDSSFTELKFSLA